MKAIHVELVTGETYTHVPVDTWQEPRPSNGDLLGVFQGNKWVYYPVASVKFFVVTEVDE